MTMEEYRNYNWEGISYPSAYIASLFNYAKSRQPKRGLEVGFDQGASALAFLYACPESELVSIDIKSCPDGAHRVQTRIPDWQERHVLMSLTDSRKQLPSMIQYGHKFDWIYIDGDHLYDAVRQDLFNAAKLLDEGGVIVVDDCVKGHELFGVDQAVQDFLREHTDFEFAELPESTSSAVILKRHG